MKVDPFRAIHLLYDCLRIQYEQVPPVWSLKDDKDLTETNKGLVEIVHNLVQIALAQNDNLGKLEAEVSDLRMQLVTLLETLADDSHPSAD